MRPRSLMTLVVLGSLVQGGLEADVEAGPAPTVRTWPHPVVLGESDEAILEVSGVPAGGVISAAVNVGAVVAVERRAEGVRLRYRLPASRFPQVLGLLLWREPPAGFWLLRIPLLGRAVVPIATRPDSTVSLQLAGRTFGPRPSGPSGRVSLEVLVPPGVTEGEAKVIDAEGLETRRLTPIRRRPYNLLTLAAQPTRSASGLRELRITAAAAEPARFAPRLVLAFGSRGQPTSLPLALVSEGRWSARWTADSTVAGPVVVRAALDGVSEQRLVVELAPAPPQPAGPSIPRPPRGARKLRVGLGLGTGLLHNFGGVVSPRFSAGAELDYPLRAGRLGARLSVGLSWASQELAGGGSPASSTTRLLLVPIGLGLVYRLPLGRLAPYAALSVLGQIVNTSFDGEPVGEGQRTDLVFGLHALGGAELGLGPGGVFAEAGYQWSRIELPEAAGLAGGLTLELGYRFHL